MNRTSNGIHTNNYNNNVNSQYGASQPNSNNNNNAVLQYSDDAVDDGAGNLASKIKPKSLTQRANISKNGFRDTSKKKKDALRYSLENSNNNTQ